MNLINYLLPSTLSHKMQRSDSIFASATLHFINQFSEYYHNTTDTTQGFVSLCEPSLIGKVPLTVLPRNQRSLTSCAKMLNRKVSVC